MGLIAIALAVMAVGLLEIEMDARRRLRHDLALLRQPAPWPEAAIDFEDSGRGGL
jgi:hypothetical protein